VDVDGEGGGKSKLINFIQIYKIRRFFQKMPKVIISKNNF
jgi:hypothetical protein